MSIDLKKLQERYRRIRLTKRLLRPLPRRANLHRYPVLKWFAETARARPYLWTFRVGAMTPAFYVGSVISLLPVMGIQIPIALVFSLLLRANLPTMVGLQLITNVFTAVPIYGATYFVGDFICSITGLHGLDIPGAPAATRFVIGGTVCGLLLGAIFDVTYRVLAYEAQKHHWHLPRRKPPSDSASPSAPPDTKV